MDKYYQTSITQILKKLNTSKTGLKLKELKKRQKKYGKNILPKSRKKVTKISLFFSQFKSLLIIILIFAGSVSFFLEEYIDSLVIFITVAINSIVGFIQEYKANTALEKLDHLVKYKNIVLRENKIFQISSQDILVGDILILEAGDKVPADARIIEETELGVDESSLTGESEPQQKNNKIIKKDLVIADRKNMLFRGTTIINGKCKAIVVKIAKNTEIGKIASLVKTIKDEKTPLQNQLNKMSKFIAAIVFVICVLIFLIGFFFSNELSIFELFETAIAVAVAAIPEGLVISLTVILAIGMQFVLKRNALVRKLIAAETLGSVSVICTDKTGTITEGKMNITRFITAGDDLNFEELKILKINDNRHSDILTGLKIGVLTNDGFIEKIKKEINFVGDTTDIAFLKMGLEIGLEKDVLEKSYKKISEITFDSKKKFMASLHKIDHSNFIYVKGAAEKLYNRCKFFEENGEKKLLNKEKLNWFKEKEKELTSKGLRVLLCAYRETDKNKLNINDVDELILVGLVAMSDPLRENVAKTIAIAKEAGIKTVMITGDHVKTAKTIAGEIGIPNDDKYIFDGEKLDQISDFDLARKIKDIYIFARVEPKHKIKIVRAFQKNGEVVAMTGDGVNDAPALKGADIGIALGSGTDVAKEISDIVLLDDNYNTIVYAIEEGRGIYQNIKKVVLYLLSGSFAEVIMVVGSLVAGLPVAALPAQILWVNLIEDSFPNIALAFDKGEKENMQDSPRRKDESLIDKEMKTMIIAKSLLANIALFIIYVFTLKITNDVALARTMVFVGFAIDSLFYIFAIRSLRHFVWQSNPFENKKLLLAVGFGWFMLLLAIYTPALQLLLRTVALGWREWGIMISFGLFNLFLIEFIKWLFIHRKELSFKK